MKRWAVEKLENSNNIKLTRAHDACSFRCSTIISFILVLKGDCDQCIWGDKTQVCLWFNCLKNCHLISGMPAQKDKHYEHSQKIWNIGAMYSFACALAMGLQEGICSKGGWSEGQTWRTWVPAKCRGWQRNTCCKERRTKTETVLEKNDWKWQGGIQMFRAPCEKKF